MRRLVLRVALTLQVHRVMRRFYRHRLIVLMYHGFRTGDTAPDPQDPEANHVHIDRFARQAAYLASWHHVVSLREVVAARREGRALPPYSVAITMDDGYRSNYTLAFPVLERWRIPATIFVTTGFVDDRQPLWPDRVAYALAATPRTAVLAELERLKAAQQAELESAVATLEQRSGRKLQGVGRGAVASTAAEPALCTPLSWDEIRTMRQSGLVEIGNHTQSHRILARCTDAAQRHEIETAHRTLEAELGEPCDLFCYPNGAPGDWNATTRTILDELGYACSPTTVPGWNDTSTDLFELRRVAINDRATQDDFVVSLYGGVRGLVRDLTRTGGPA